MDNTKYAGKFITVLEQLSHGNVHKCIEILTAESSSHVAHNVSPLQLTWGDKIVLEGDYIVLFEDSREVDVMRKAEFDSVFGVL